MPLTWATRGKHVGNTFHSRIAAKFVRRWTCFDGFLDESFLLELSTPRPAIRWTEPEIPGNSLSIRAKQFQGFLVRCGLSAKNVRLLYFINLLFFFGLKCLNSTCFFKTWSFLFEDIISFSHFLPSLSIPFSHLNVADIQRSFGFCFLATTWQSDNKIQI